MTQVVWVHSGGWRTQAAISYIGVHNAWSFAQAGVKSHLLLPSASVEEPVETGLREHYGLDPHPDLEVRRVKLQRRWWHLHHPFYSEARHYVEALRQHTDPAEPLVVLTREQRFLPDLARLARLPRTVTLFEPHYFFVDQAWRGMPISSGDKRRGALERRCLPRLHGLVCITGEQEQLYRGAMPDLATLYAPLGVKRLTPDLQARPEWRERRTLAYIGHLHGYKGIDALVALGKRFDQINVRVDFFGGAPEEVESYRSQCQSREVKSLAWHPFVPPAQIFPVLARTASVGIVALENTYYNRNLTCPVKALDFLALGLPVVASDLPSTRGVLGKAGVYFEPGNTDAMLSEVDRLMTDPAIYAATCQASRQRAEELDWVNRARSILAFAQTQLQ